MKVNRKQFLDVLSTVDAGLAGKEVIENSTSFIFTDNRVMTYNDEVCVSHPFEIDIEGAVASKELKKLLTKLTDEEIDLYVEKGHLIVERKKKKSGIIMEADIENTIKDISSSLGKVKKWNGLPAAFTKCLTYCLFSIGRDMTKVLLTCIHCEGSDMVSSDGIRITACDLGKKVDFMPLNIPGTAASELRAFNPVEYAATSGWLHFRAENDAIFSCRTIEDKYPTTTTYKILDAAEKGDTIKLPLNLNQALDCANIFSNHEVKTVADNRINVVIEDGQLTITGTGKTGFHIEKCKLKYSGDPIEFEVNPTFLQSILAHTDEVIFNDRTLCFVSDDFTHVILTMKPKK